ncbi:hypothetical protein LTR37_019240 [Vermiconidia calcicola]|uniref:Uncharacterized protein n=1 Tax=Vermiconidia calcicola TaxID=1690605 RepID=A0ACC3MEY6_9PEZI|nr:hypothetical protein LTR37_019240 [Vermiconidia calcicola]
MVSGVKQPTSLECTDTDHASDCSCTRLALCKPPPSGKVVHQALLENALVEGESSRWYTLPGILSRSLLADSIPGSMLYAAPLACYALWKGRQSNNSSLIDASHQLYIRGLVETQKALMTFETARVDATLAACNALGLYEVLECPERSVSAYKWHRDACCRLIKIRGPGAHQDGIAHELFTSIRLFGVSHRSVQFELRDAADNNQVLESLETAHPTFFSDPKWMSTPWKLHPKSSLDKLIDICTLGPEMLLKAKRLSSLPPAQTLPAALNIVQDLGRSVATLEIIYADLYASYPQPMYWERPLPEAEITSFAEVTCESGIVDHSRDPLIFPPALHFHDLDLASTLSMYWSMSAIAWSGIADLHNLFSRFNATTIFASAFHAAGATAADLTPETLQQQWTEEVRKILQSVTYCTSAAALRYGPPRIATALNVVIDVTKHKEVCASEHAWALRARREIGTKWISMLRYQ